MQVDIHITGGLGFIGSNLVRHLNASGIVPYIYDTLTHTNWRNVIGLNFILEKPTKLITRSIGRSDVLIHLGANAATTAIMGSELWENNVTYSIDVISRFTKVIYASSAATYGAEEENFKERISDLKPLNAYGFTKWHLDNVYFGQKTVNHPANCYGLRFFNVYGPNEVHKGEMQSVVSKVIHGVMPLCHNDRYRLFKSDREGIEDGGQKRDFVYVGDVCKVIDFFIKNNPRSGVYNVGSGKARTFLDLVKITKPDAEIDFVDMPATLKGQYQYFTQADLTKLREAGYTEEFTSLEDGIAETKALTSGLNSIKVSGC